MHASAEKRARIGADFLICPDNTIHEALPLVLLRSLLPWSVNGNGHVDKASNAK